MKRSSGGFSLLEVLIALAILGMSLGVLLQSQAQSLDATGRARDYNIASTLMRLKLVDIEAEVLEDGFVLGSNESEGDFAEDGFPDFKWKAKVSEIEMDLTSISSLCESMMGSGEGDELGGGDDAMAGGMTCESLLGGAAGSVLQSVSEDLTRGMRAIEVRIEWKNAGYTEGFSTRAIITRPDFDTEGGPR